MLWFGVQGSGRAQKKASSATETQSHEKNGREFHEAQSRDQSMNETTDEHRFICGVVQSTPAPKKDFVIQGFFDSRFVRSAKKTPQGRREHRVLCAPAVSRGIYLSLPKLGEDR